MAAIADYVGWLSMQHEAAILLAAGLFPNTKEITESASAFHAALRHLPSHVSRRTRTVRCFAIGDGKRPLTGALVATQTGWTVHSVDPRLEHHYMDHWFDKNLKNTPRWRPRLHCHNKRAEDLDLASVASDPSDELYIILAVHSHANLDWFQQRLRAHRPNVPILVVAIPCCVPQDITDQDYFLIEDADDELILESPKRRVIVGYIAQQQQPPGLIRSPL